MNLKLFLPLPLFLQQAQYFKLYCSQQPKATTGHLSVATCRALSWALSRAGRGQKHTSAFRIPTVDPPCPPGRHSLSEAVPCRPLLSQICHLLPDHHFPSFLILSLPFFLTDFCSICGCWSQVLPQGDALSLFAQSSAILQPLNARSAPSLPVTSPPRTQSNFPERHYQSDCLE